MPFYCKHIPYNHLFISNSHIDLPTSNVSDFKYKVNCTNCRAILLKFVTTALLTWLNESARHSSVVHRHFPCCPSKALLSSGVFSVVHEHALVSLIQFHLPAVVSFPDGAIPSCHSTMVPGNSCSLSLRILVGCIVVTNCS